MDSINVEILRCGVCMGSLRPSRMGRDPGGKTYGILECGCGRYPVVADIPVLQSDKQRLLHLISKGAYEEALLTAAAPRVRPSSPMLPAFVRRLAAIRGLSRPRRWFVTAANGRCRSELGKLLANPTTTFSDLLNFRYRKALGWNDAYEYFRFRLGQPRHLVALSLAAMIQRPTKAILALGCGFGQMTNALIRRANGQSVIGIDEDFFALFVAKHWIAPEAEFICCKADEALPFPESTFSATYSFDAFHYFTKKALCVREARRVTDDDGFVSFGSVRNGSFRHSYWGKPFQAAGYRALFERIPHCLLSERDILARYLKGMGPLLTDSGDEDLANEPLLSIVVSDNRTIFRDYGQFQSWPHAEGQLALNPLYRVVKGDGGVALRREFPSRWYEEENADCRRYLPTEVPISPEVLTDLVQGNVTAEIRGLIDKFVVLGNSFKGRPQMSAQRGDPPL